MPNPFRSSVPDFAFQTHNDLQNEPTSEVRARAFAELRPRIMRVEILDSDTGMDELVIQLNNRDGNLLRNHEIWFGRVWGVSIGYQDQQSNWRFFRVTSLRGYQVMELRAYSLDEYTLNFVEKSQEWKADTVIPILKSIAAPRLRDGKSKLIRRSDVAEAIALGQGFGPVGTFDVQETAGDFEKIMQTNMTDAKMLTKMADALGFVWFVESYRTEGTKRPASTLHFHSRDFGQDPSYIFDLDDEMTIGEPEMDFDVFDIPNIGIARGLNPVELQLHKEEINLETARRVMTGTATPIRDYEKAFPSTGQKPNQIAEERDGIFKKWEEQLLKISITMIGDPNVYPKTTCLLKNFQPFLNNIPFYVDSVKYTLIPGESFRMTLGLRGKAMNYNSSQEVARELFRLVRLREEHVKRVSERIAHIRAELARAQREAQNDEIILEPGPGITGTRSPSGQYIRGYKIKNNRRRKPPRDPNFIGPTVSGG